MTVIRLAWWLFFIIALVLLFHPLVMGQEPVPIKCNDTHCIVPKALLLSLAEQAQQVQHYRDMCGWEK